MSADAAGLDPRRLGWIDERLQSVYIDTGKIAGCQIAVSRRGQIAHFSALGSMDRERDKPVADDTIWRIFSMTKPITGVALLSLYEQGLFQLNDPVHEYIPAWRDLKVKERADDGSVRLVEPRRPMTVRDLMMHTSGLDYSMPATEGAPESGATLETFIDWLAGRPLKFHPGTKWLYSVGTDVCGHLVEVISGKRFDDYLQSAIFDPLGMVDTGFAIDDERLDRFAAGYICNGAGGYFLADDPCRSPFRNQPTFLSGGGGLLSTTADYLKFCQMLAAGGELDGVRILSRKTVELMSSNHLPDDGTLRDLAVPGTFGEVGFDGIGFGLTVAVGLEPTSTQVAGSSGEFMWGGAGSTVFWIDPVEHLTVVFMTQLFPSGSYNFREMLKTIVYGAVAD